MHTSTTVYYSLLQSNTVYYCLLLSTTVYYSLILLAGLTKLQSNGLCWGAGGWGPLRAIWRPGEIQWFSSVSLRIGYLDEASIGGLVIGYVGGACNIRGLHVEYTVKRGIYTLLIRAIYGGAPGRPGMAGCEAGDGCFPQDPDSH